MKRIILIALFLVLTIGEIMAVEVGSPAPKVSGTGYDLKPVELSDYQGKNLVLAFVPGAFTGVCTKEICTFQDAIAKLNNLNANVVGVAVDAPFSNKAWADQNKVTFPILSDYDLEMVKAFDCYHEDFAGMKGYTAAKRSVFIIDKDGIVRYKWISDNPGVEPNYEEIENELKKLD
jgi:peroxiredoxin